ncbi:universal stress protein [Paenibacillus protaetiae]|uniref:Universal stress protein n=1 Tax=Paenibacillus protaetiae TaxID=2509456 RepID=A0A4P6F0L5_9BACL|nr:universal stress protein [Paenibacillus protaetiae]QAY66537.1 universal stress protein [Paenibacillus protaetiae]
MYKHILVPVDGSQQSEKALEHAVRLAEALQADTQITVLHVTPPIVLNEPEINVDRTDCRRSGQSYLQGGSS